MNQLDWIGGTLETPFRDIRNTRPSVAEEKAILARDLGLMARKIPKAYQDWSVNRVREFVAAQKKAIKLAAGKNSSVPDLTSAMTNLKRYWA